MIRGASSSSKGLKPIMNTQKGTKPNGNKSVIPYREFKTNIPLTIEQKKMLDNILAFHCAGLKGLLCSEMHKVASTFRNINKMKVEDLPQTKILTTTSRNAMVENILKVLPEEIQDKVSSELKQKSQEQYRKILMEVIPSHFQHLRMIKIKGINPFHLKFMSSHPLSCFTEEVRKLLDWGMIDFLIINSATNLDYAPKCLTEILHRILSEIQIQRIIIQVTSIPPEWTCYDLTNMFYRYLPAIHCFTVYPERKIKDSYGYISYDLFQTEERILELLLKIDISKTLAYHRAHSILEFKEKSAFNSRSNSIFIYSSPHNFVFIAEGRWIDYQKRLKEISQGDIDMSQNCAHALSDLEELDAYHNSFLYPGNEEDDFWDSLDEEGTHNLLNAMEG